MKIKDRKPDLIKFSSLHPGDAFRFYYSDIDRTRSGLLIKLIHTFAVGEERETNCVELSTGDIDYMDNDRLVEPYKNAEIDPGE